MRRPEKRKGYVLADLHAHLANYKSEESTLEALTSGLIGLAFLDYEKSHQILTYEQAVKLPGVDEIERGLLAKVTYKGNTGYVLKTQELRVLEDVEHHILAVGIREYLPNYDNAERAISAAREQGAVLVLNHPYVVPHLPAVGYRLITAEEEKRVREIAALVDEIEVFNGQCVNTTWLGRLAMTAGELLLPEKFSNLTSDMTIANSLAWKLARDCGYKGTAASDTHWRMEQVGTSGIWIPEKDLCFRSLKEAITGHNFECQEQYVSLLSFGRGMFLG